MTAEAPIQIDLSQENSWDKIDDSLLTEEERKLLAEQFSKEAEGIIYLTQQEIQDFKNILSSEIPEIVSSELQEFATEQKIEGLSSSDLVGDMEGLPEDLLDWVDVISYETLFWKEGIMKDIELSDTAKDNIAVSLSLSAIKELQNVNLENYEKKFEELLPKLDIIQNVFWHIEGSWVGDLEHSLFIAWKGEQNYIFMDAMEGVKFFTSVFTGDIEENTIEPYIEERNLPAGSTTEITHRMSALQEFSEENTKAFIQNLPNIVQNNEDIDIPENIPNTPKAQQSLIERLKNGNFFEKIFAVLLEAMKGFGLYNEDATETSPEQETNSSREKQEVAETDAFMKLLQDSEKYWSDNSEFQTVISELEKNPKTLRQVKTIMESIPDETFQESFADLFGESRKFSQISKVFNDYGFNERLSQDISQSENLVALMTEYARYRNSPEVQGKESNRTSWLEYAQKRQKENWDLSGR